MVTESKTCQLEVNILIDWRLCKHRNESTKKICKVTTTHRNTLGWKRAILFIFVLIEGEKGPFGINNRQTAFDTILPVDTIIPLKAGSSRDVI
jgi:hypothetical protein